MSRSIRIDLVSAFGAAGAKALAYAVISSLLLAGGANTPDVAMFTVIRSTLGLLNYATLGIAPAFIREMAAMLTTSGAGVDVSGSVRRLYASALYPALAIGFVALLFVLGYSAGFDWIHIVPESMLRYAPIAALLVGLAMLSRLISDVPGGYLQASHHITLDSILVGCADLAWPILTWLLIRVMPTTLLAASAGLCICYVTLTISRFVAAWACGAPAAVSVQWIERPMARHMLGFGILLTLSQLSDFLYAPTDFLLINWFLTPKDTVDYTYAVQLDAGMLLLASAVWTVLYPRASRAVAARDAALLRRYFWRGTVLTFVALVAVSGVLLVCIKPVLTVWLRTDLPGTRAILPLLLVHTVVGGSTAAIRAILFAAGKARVFAISAVVAGVLNVIVSFILVRYTGLGLVGVVLGTLSAVVIRCGIFLPWYTLRTLRELPIPSPADLPAEQTAMDEPL